MHPSQKVQHLNQAPQQPKQAFPEKSWVALESQNMQNLDRFVHPEAGCNKSV